MRRFPSFAADAGDDDLTKEIQDQLEATNPEKAVKSPDKPVAPKK